jgi:2-polyprenyl-6-methoxyphenol hydroxylase-like FAD-dependent oxidoreductase
MQKEITIIGAGIGGLTLAKALELKKIPFQLYEQSNSFEALGFGIQASPNVNRIFNALGLKDKMAAISHKCHKIEVRTFKKWMRNFVMQTANRIAPDAISKRLNWLYDYDATKVV